MDDLERIITVMEEQIALCGTDGEHDRITVYMTADDSKRIVRWLKTIKAHVEPHKGEAVIWHGGTEHYYLIDTCGACNERINEETMFCPYCGTPVKWN